MNLARDKRGSALLVAVAIFAVLIALGLTFYLTTRYEWRTASSVVAAQRAELAANGGLAIAMAFLARDLQAHATYTSADHAVGTYFNGSWVVGKPWALPEGPLEEGGVPKVSLQAQETVVVPSADVNGNLIAVQQQQYAGKETGEWLYIPRYVPTGGNSRQSITMLGNLVLNMPFVIPYEPDPTTPTAEQLIDTWADVDNDEDGLRDSMWIPLPKERNFGRIDYTNDGIIDIFGDGLDNDLDGETDEFNEYAYFIYYGGNDGLDNDGDGLIDRVADPDEDRVFVTAPIGQPGNYVTLLNLQQRDPQTLAVTSAIGPLNTDPASGNVDDLDNDWDLVGSNHDEYVLSTVVDYSIPTDPRVNQELGKAYNLIASQYIGVGNYGDAVGLATPAANGPFQASSLTASGEPVCDIVGRFAVLIRDENSKMNMNAVGGHTYALGMQTDPMRSLNEGVSSSEIDTRILPQIGFARARSLWEILTGAPAGLTGAEPAFADFYEDSLRPGYGLTDDNGNALSLALNGIDDDGDALYYQIAYGADGVDNDGDGLIDEVGEGYQIGVDEGLRGYDTNGDGTADLLPELEGVDEPTEYRTFQPYRNLVAEVSGSDNDLDGVPDEFGEIGDNVLRTREQLQLADGIAEARYGNLRNLISLHAIDKDDARVERAAGFNTLDFVGAYNLPSGLRALNGMKLDINYASADQIADRLRVSWGYQPTLLDTITNTSSFYSPNLPSFADFMRGMRREDTTLDLTSLGGTQLAAIGYVNPEVGTNLLFPADQELRASQLATTLKDHSDEDHSRTSVTTSMIDSWWSKLADANTALPPRAIDYTVAGIESIRINELMVRPVRRVEAEADTNGGPQEQNPNVLATPYALPRFSTSMVLGETFADYDGAASGWALDTSAAVVNSLGPNTVWGISGLSVPIDIDIVNNPGTNFALDTLQFMFTASPDLPPGRYYLVVHTRDVDGNITVDDASDLEYQFKYVQPGASLGATFDGSGGTYSVGPTTILQDRTTLATDVGFWNPLVAENLGRTGPNGNIDLTGAVFLGDDALISPIATPDGYRVGVISNFSGCAVEIPPYSASSPIYLCVAIRRTAANNTPLAIDSFDFSQEPDHEYIEITNIAERDPAKSVFDQAINIAGWQLEVNRVSGPTTTGRKLLTVPGSTVNKQQGTLIPPGGSLLLAVNKFDEAGNTNSPRFGHRIYGNGIGMLRGLVPTALGNVNFYNFVSAPPLTQPSVDATETALMQGKSVFWRPDTGIGFYTDFVDRDGNLLTDSVLADNLIQSTQDPIGSEGPAKAWDRIVELISTEVESVSDSASLKRMVLGGGLLPNYPEEDGIDNDGDDLVLRNDLVDNDGDGKIDESALEDNGVGEDGRNEGVDEGRWPTLPALPPIPDTPREWQRPGTYAASDDDPVPYWHVNPALLATYTPGDTGTPFSDPYLGAMGATLPMPPDQKDFQERRWYPGDNVVVTLYEGDASQGRISDQVTYTQNDVENRFIDDNQSVAGVREALNIHNANYWPVNTMGVDFYFSLQRKHPLYAGDLHGVTNRWQATDGAYDDWQLYRNLSALATRASHTPLSRNTMYAIWNPSSGVANTEFTYLNSALWAVVRGDGFDGYDFFGNLGMSNIRPGDALGWVRNNDYVSPGDAVRLPHFQSVKAWDNTAEFGGQIAQEFLIGQYSARDVSAVVDSMSMASLNLTAGQADFTSLLPRAGTPQFDTPLAQADVFGSLPEPWVPVFLNYLPGDEGVGTVYSKNYLLSPPDLPTTVLTDLYPRARLQHRPDRPGVDANGVSPVDEPLTLPRAVMYISGNAANFQQSDDHIVNDPNTPVSEALFVWDAGDGLQNGEYDAYVVTAEPVQNLANATALTGPATTTFGNNIGAALLQSARTDNARTLYVDLEFFTDRAGRDDNWGRTVALTVDGSLNMLGIGPNGSPDTIGLVAGLAPSSDGVVHYGIVKVENNRLALRLRNWAERGRLNRFSRVVLSPRHRVPGRININTAHTQLAEFTQGSNVKSPFNPLLGVPGMMLNFDAAGLPVPFAYDYNPSPADAAYQAALVRSQWVAANRTVYHDGRYYTRTSDLVAIDDDIYGRAVPTSQALVPGVTSDPIARYEETAERFSRMANLISTRSDTFEIIVTAEVGTISNQDENNDGRINYRGDFLAEGQKKIRMVYER